MATEVHGDASSSEGDEMDNVSVLDGVAEFHDPDMGTPAAEALAANAALRVTKYEKYFARRIKTHTLKKIIRNIKPRDRSRRRFEGKKIDGLHELYTLSLGMMLGLRAASGHQHHMQQNNRVEHTDFVRADKYVFPPKGSSGPMPTPPHSLAHTFKFKNYAPAVFRSLRHMYGIDTASYMMSVCGNSNFIEFIPNSKSGQFFFYSHDRKYVIKTQTPEENAFLLRILPQYYEYLKQNPHTFLVRFFGMHRVKMYHLRRRVHFVIMGCVVDPNRMHAMYDLKGSTIGRRARRPASAKEVDEISEAESKRRSSYSGGASTSVGPGFLSRFNSLSFRNNHESKEEIPPQRVSVEMPDDGRLEVLKDLDFIADSISLHLGRHKESILAQLRKDAEFLASLGIMDYSLLLGMRSTLEDDISCRHIDSPSSVHSALQKTASDIDLRPRDSEDLPMLSGPIRRLGSSKRGTPDSDFDLGMPVKQSSFGQLPSTRSFKTERLTSHQDASIRRERRKENCPWQFREDGGIVASVDGEPAHEVYYMGVIDILTQYNQFKRLETRFKKPPTFKRRNQRSTSRPLSNSICGIYGTPHGLITC